MKVIRDGKEKGLSVTVGAQPKELAGEPIEESSAPVVEKADKFLDGVEIADLDRSTRRQSGLPPTMRGVVVTKVEPNSKAAGAELSEGDLIAEINRRPVRNVEEAMEAISLAKGGRVLLRVYARNASGGGSTYYISVETGKK